MSSVNPECTACAKCNLVDRREVCVQRAKDDPSFGDVSVGGAKQNYPLDAGRQGFEMGSGATLNDSQSVGACEGGRNHVAACLAHTTLHLAETAPHQRCDTKVAFSRSHEVIDASVAWHQPKHCQDCLQTVSRSRERNLVEISRFCSAILVRPFREAQYERCGR